MLKKILQNIYIYIYFYQRQFNYESKYNAQAIYNKHISLYKQKVKS